ncbi:hypothetical protein [Pseudomonas cyclaminis]|uniref:hypothetical protein n=1 Tax=Pseudomonas cyclaminis TaxID=2781239 RepID=UPI00381182B7
MSKHTAIDDQGGVIEVLKCRNGFVGMVCKLDSPPAQGSPSWPDHDGQNILCHVALPIGVSQATHIVVRARQASAIRQP